jgi:hypothetical protein
MTFVTAPRTCSPVAELLRRCSAVHHFDAVLVEVLCRAPPELVGVGLDELIAAGAVEPVPGRPERFRLPDPDRRELYAGWWDEEDAVVPARLRQLSERVLAHLSARPRAAGEALFHELIVAPAPALQRFAAAFREADGAGDLARCQDLLDVVIERRSLLGEEGAALCDEYQRRLRSRALWLRDWRRSARYVVPAATRTATEALVAGEPRALELWSDAGLGKSSYLRWLLARRCVPAGIACARIDFEAVDPVRAGREPWLLLLELAEQLDRQLVGAPFAALLEEHPGQRERLLRRPTTAPALGAAAADVPERFAGTLRADGRPVVIAFDTVDAVPERGALFALLGGLLDAVPGLRLVLASRERLEFPGARALRMTRLSEDEARRYLRARHGVAEGALADRIVASAGGIPLKLELIADVAETSPGLDPGELDACADPDLAHLTERLLMPLDPDLGALLVCGAAPRTLEHDFAVGVIAPLLGGRDVDALWRALRHHATSASWVQLDPLDVHTVRFHPAIAAPLRRRLRAAPEHDALHIRAAAWFEARALRDPAHATRWLCEATFHRFQLDAESACRAWEASLHAARSEHRPDRRYALAAEVLGRDYATRLPRHAELRARWELAVAAVQLAHRDAPGPRAAHARAAERALANLRHGLSHARSRNGTPRVRACELALVEAGVALVRGDALAARPHVERALRGGLAREDELWLRLAYAGALPGCDARHAAAHFRSSLAFARRGHPWDVAAVHLQLAVRYEALDQLDRAVAACADAASHACPRQAVELALVRARLEVRRGAPSSALTVLDEVTGDEPDVDVRCTILRVRALLAAGAPRQALALADATAAACGPHLRSAGDRYWAIAAEGRELRGTVNEALHDVERALADYAEAAERWHRLGATDAVCRCHLRAAALHLHEAAARRGGVLASAMQPAAARLEVARRLRLERGSDVWSLRLLVGAEVSARLDDRERAAALVGEALEGLARADRPPERQIAAVLTGLAVTEGEAQAALVNGLCAQLSRVTPATARLAVLDGIDRCPVLSVRASARMRLRRLVPSPVHAAGRFTDVPEPDRQRLAVRDAELDRVVGRSLQQACNPAVATS